MTGFYMKCNTRPKWVEKLANKNLLEEAVQTGSEIRLFLIYLKLLEKHLQLIPMSNSIPKPCKLQKQPLEGFCK